MPSFLLSLCCVVSGIVRAASGQPLLDATIVLHGASTARTTSDAAGAFSLRAKAGTYELRAADRGYAAVSVGPIDLTRDVRVEVALEPLDSPKLRTIGSVTVDGRLARITGTIPSVELTRADFDRAGESRIVEGLLQVPSLDVQYPHNAGMGGIATVSLRGPDPSETMLTLDGQLLNDANTGDVDISELPVAAFSAASVAEGLGPEDLEGSSTFGGAVNLVSLRPTQAAHAAISLSAGSFGQSEMWYNATGSLHRLGYAIALDNQQEAGYVNEIDPVCPIGGGGSCAPQHLGSSVSQRTALLNLAYRFSQNADVDARAFMLGDVRDQSAGITGYENVAGGPLYGPGNQIFSQSIRAYQVRGRAPLGAGELVAQASASDDNVDVNGGIASALYDLSHQDTRTLASLEWDRSFDRSAFAVGGYVRHETFIAPGTLPSLSQSVASYFARAQWQPGQKVHLSAGIYASKYTTFGSNLDGRFGAVYDADPATSLRFSIGTGFRAPLLIERYVFPVNQLPPPDNNCVQAGQGNPDENPEHATEYELGASHQFGGRATLDASLYRTNLRDPIETYYPLNTYNAGCARTYTSYPVNVGNAVYQGAELRYSVRPNPQIFLTLMYGLNVAYPRNLPATVSNPTSGATLVNGQQFPNIPQQQGSVEVDWAQHGWHAALDGEFRGPNNPLNQGPLFFADAAVGRNVTAHLDVTLAATNLLNAAAGKFQVFQGGRPYYGIVGNGRDGPVPTNLLTTEPMGLRLSVTLRQ